MSILYFLVKELMIKCFYEACSLNIASKIKYKYWDNAMRTKSLFDVTEESYSPHDPMSGSDVTLKVN